MFSPASNASDHNAYDFGCEENASKWRSLLVTPLQKVQKQVHPSLHARDDALEYIEALILQLLGMLCQSQPHTVQDVEDRVSKTFPHPIDKWAIADAQNALEKGKKKSPLVLPVDKIHPLLVREVLGYKVESQVTLYIVAVLEYIAADIFKLTGNYVKNIKHPEITCQDIKVAMCADKVLMDMFFQDDDVALGVEEERTCIYVRRGSLTYEEIVKDFVLEENQYMRDLNMIIKVFRDPFVKLFDKSKDLEVIFSNILEVQMFTAKLLSSVEDTLEMTEENAVPLVGGCFEELVEGAEFDVYEKYADDIVKPNGRERLNTLLQRQDVMKTLMASGHLFREAVKYVLPKLLLGPIYHCLHYFDIIKALIDTSGDEDDRECLEQALGVLHLLKLGIERKLGTSLPKRKPGELSLRFQGRGDRQVALTKMNELQKSIDGWEGKDIGQSCNEFIMEGALFKYTSKRNTERYVFLFDGLIILTKQNMRRSSVTGPVGDYKLKEKFNMRKVDIFDRDDVEGQELKFAFEMRIKDHPNVVLAAKTSDDKNNWMAAIVQLLYRSNLERMLDSLLMNEEKKHPLMLPPPEKYRFAAEDSEENIVFEDNQDPGTESPLVKGGTLLKLIDRLTYHTYANPKFVRTFLTTYRSFCKPSDLLDLLIDRFDIPEPEVTDMITDQGDVDTAARDVLKRFRKEYSKPIQIRVLNVLRHWVDQHWYDFEWDPELLVSLQHFLDTVKGKAMRKCVESIQKAIKRRLESPPVERQITYEKQPPSIEWHITKDPESFDIMTLHPVEIARQVTLLEFDLYRAVKPSEMVGSVWIKKQKNITSANLLKMIHHSTMFTFWLERCIIESENFEERVAVVQRTLEIMQVFLELNNFNGVLEVVAALNSAPVFRLRYTFEEIDNKYHKLKKVFDEAKELNSDHFKQYQEKLRSINPPCVPFLGMYLTNILHIEEGNPDFLPNRPEGIINFSKRRKVAEITQEIQQYQNQPYCLTSEAEIREFFENLNPLEDRTEKEFNDYLYAKSLEIEPRYAKPTKYDRKREYTLKSPGIKSNTPRHSSGRSQHPTSLPTPSAPSTPTFQHSSEDPMGVSDLDAQSSCAGTPDTPSTPLTPPHDSNDHSVFANVQIPFPEAIQMMTFGAVPNNIGPPTPQPQPPVLQPLSTSGNPPPLPPRRKRETSTSTIGGDPSVRQAADAPSLPPRGSAAPPLPPRREPPSHATLPRAHCANIARTNSMSLPQQPLVISGTTATLPRRNSERDQVHANVNGERGGSVTPELPPKTYRAAHSRKQSS